jgi:hypothetical protein
MTVEADLQTVLTSVVARSFPDFAPTKTGLPYCTFQQIGGEAVNYVDATMPDHDHGEFQVNVWAATRKEAKALIKQIDAALRGAAAFTARPVSGPVSDFDADMKRYGSRQDFSIWSPA